MSFLGLSDDYAWCSAMHGFASKSEHCAGCLCLVRVCLGVSRLSDSILIVKRRANFTRVHPSRKIVNSLRIISSSIFVQLKFETLQEFGLIVKRIPGVFPIAINSLPRGCRRVAKRR